MDEEFAVFFDNGTWVVMLKSAGAVAQVVARHTTLEECIMEVSLITGAPVGIKVITKRE